MKAGTGYTLILIIFFILLGLWKNLSKKEKPDEIVIDGIHIPRKPCINVINELYGAGIDSSKFCDCLIPKFYELIKDDSIKLAKFKDAGIHSLEGEENKKSTILFENCLKAAMLDSNYKLHLTGVYLKGFKEKLKDHIILLSINDNYEIESLSNCISDKMKDNVTLGEYLSEDYSKNEKFMTLFKQCLDQSKR
jgi:hypothetical protein